MKECTVCKLAKPLDCFSKDRRKSDGLCVRCKECRRDHYLANREAELAQAKVRYVENKERHDRLSLAYYYANKVDRSKKMAEWYQANRSVVAENTSRWRRANRERVAGYSRERKAIIKRATPKWADMDAIDAIYEKARQLTEETGVPHCVDHIVPMRSDRVSGLHCEGNLQIITTSENSSKSNRHWPDSSVA